MDRNNNHYRCFAGRPSSSRFRVDVYSPVEATMVAAEKGNVILSVILSLHHVSRLVWSGVGRVGV